MKKKFLVITLISALILSCSAFIIGIMPEKAMAAEGDSAPQITMAGASIRTAAPFGLRFEAEIDQSVNVHDITELGMYLCPTDLLTNGEFPTGDALSNALIQGEDLATETKYIKRVVVGGKEVIKPVTDENGTHNRFYLALVNIVPSNLDRKFSAMAYIKIGEGEETKAETCERSVAYVAREAKADRQSGLEGDSLKFVESIIADSNELSVLSGVADMAAENRHNGQFSRKITLTEATKELKLRVNYKKMEGADKCSLEMYAKAAGEGVKIGGQTVSTDGFTKLHFENLALTKQELTLSLEGTGDLWIDDIKYMRISNADGTAADIGGENVTKLGVDCLEINADATQATLTKDETTNFMVYKDKNGASYAHAYGCFHIKELTKKVKTGDYIVFRIKMTEDTVNGIVRNNNMKLYYQSATELYKYMQFFDEQGNDWSFYEKDDIKAPYNMLCNADYVPQADTWYYAVTLYGYQDDFEWFRAITGPFEITFGEVYKLSEAGKNEHFHTGIRPIILNVPETLSIAVGEIQKLDVTVKGGDNPVIEYKVLNDSTLVSVDAEGNVTAGANAGSCTIEIKAGNVVKTCAVTVNNVVITCPERLYTYVGDTINVGAVMTGSSNPLKYTSGNTSIATVNETTGEVTPVASGSYSDITVAVDGVTATCRVYVNEASLKPPVLEGEGVTPHGVECLEMASGATCGSMTFDEQTGFMNYIGDSSFASANGRFHIKEGSTPFAPDEYIAFLFRYSADTVFHTPYTSSEGLWPTIVSYTEQKTYSYMAMFDVEGNDWTIYSGQSGAAGNLSNAGDTNSPYGTLNRDELTTQPDTWYYFVSPYPGIYVGETEFTNYYGEFKFTIANVYAVNKTARDANFHINRRQIVLNAPDTLTLVVGESKNLGATVFGGDNPVIEYTVLNESTLVEVDANGNVTAGSNTGSCTIEIKAGNVVKTCDVTVRSVVITCPSHLYTYVGDTISVNAIVAGTQNPLKYTSGDTAIAMVNEDTGEVTAVKSGSCEITVTVDGVEEKCLITVNEAALKPPVLEGEGIRAYGVECLEMVPGASCGSMTLDEQTGFMNYVGDSSFERAYGRFHFKQGSTPFASDEYIVFQFKYSADTVFHEPYTSSEGLWPICVYTVSPDTTSYMAMFDADGKDWTIYNGQGGEAANLSKTGDITYPYGTIHRSELTTQPDTWYYFVSPYTGILVDNSEFSNYYGDFKFTIANVYAVDQMARDVHFRVNVRQGETVNPEFIVPDMTISPKETDKIKPTVKYPTEYYSGFSYEILDSSQLVTVDGEGNVTAGETEGSCDIRVSVNGFEPKVCHVTVKAPIPLSGDGVKSLGVDRLKLFTVGESNGADVKMEKDSATGYMIYSGTSSCHTTARFYIDGNDEEGLIDPDSYIVFKIKLYDDACIGDTGKGQDEGFWWHCWGSAGNGYFSVFDENFKDYTFYNGEGKPYGTYNRKDYDKMVVQQWYYVVSPQTGHNVKAEGWTNAFAEYYAPFKIAIADVYTITGDFKTAHFVPDTDGPQL